MPGATQHDVPMTTVYRIPANTQMVVHRTASAIPGDYRPQDYMAIVSTKAVTYTSADVLMDPNSHEWLGFSQWGIQHSEYFQAHAHWAFRLPKNAKGAAFILVHQRDVHSDRVPDDTTVKTKSWSEADLKKMSDLMNNIVKIDESKAVTQRLLGLDDEMFSTIVNAKHYLMEEITKNVVRDIDRDIMKSYNPRKETIVTL